MKLIKRGKYWEPSEDRRQKAEAKRQRKQEKRLQGEK